MSLKEITHAQRLLRLPKVLEQVGVSRSCWYQGVKDGRYPSQSQLRELFFTFLHKSIAS